MNILSVPFAEIGTEVKALDWLTHHEVKGGKNEERYWIVRTDAQINNPDNDLPMFRLMAFLDQAQRNQYQLVQIIKETPA
jgi:hypothetical protein